MTKRLTVLQFHHVCFIRRRRDHRRYDFTPENAPARAAIAVLVPLGVALLVGVLTSTVLYGRADAFRPSAVPILAALGIASWFVGLRLYGLRGMGLRGGRPLFAGIGFAVLAWVALLVARLLPSLPTVSFNPDGQAVVQMSLLVEVARIQSAGAGREFLYLLLFEAFATQLWTFGVGFHGLADWRGPLSAAVLGGLLFGATGYILFQESFVQDWISLIYFLVWGVLYGIIRLRTGSILGIVLVQALASFTAWFVFQPPVDLPVAGLHTVYFAVIVLYAIIIWRLWPKVESDYRV
ncbi:MAG: hypothetical protein R3C44_01040 [Chloroflexota bacterium]